MSVLSGQPGPWLIANEFAAVEVSLDHTANGPRLRVRDLDTHAEGFLDPLDLASMCVAGPEQRAAWLRSAPYREAAVDRPTETKERPEWT